VAGPEGDASSRPSGGTTVKGREATVASSSDAKSQTVKQPEKSRKGSTKGSQSETGKALSGSKLFAGSAGALSDLPKGKLIAVVGAVVAVLLIGGVVVFSMLSSSSSQSPAPAAPVP